MVCFGVFARILLSSATLISALPPQSSNLLPLETVRLPREWQQGPPPPANQLLRFRIAIRQMNAFAFEQHVLAISDPEHPTYGQHMKRHELKSMLRPSEAASTAILSWLRREGISEGGIEDDGDVSFLYRNPHEISPNLQTRPSMQHTRCYTFDHRLSSTLF